VTHGMARAPFLSLPSEGAPGGSSDAGEPAGTAGRPILSVLTGSGLGDCTVVVTWAAGPAPEPSHPIPITCGAGGGAGTVTPLSPKEPFSGFRFQDSEICRGVGEVLLVRVPRRIPPPRPRYFGGTKLGTGGLVKATAGRRGTLASREGEGVGGFSVATRPLWLSL